MKVKHGIVNGKIEYLIPTYLDVVHAAVSPDLGVDLQRQLPGGHQHAGDGTLAPPQLPLVHDVDQPDTCIVTNSPLCGDK